MPGSGDMIGFKFLPGLATIRALISFSPSPWASLLIYSVVGLVLSAIFAWIVIMALGALVSSVRAIDKGKDLDFPEALKTASKEFWRLLGVVVLVKLASLAAALVIGINLINYNRGSGMTGGIFFFLSFAIFGAITVIVSLVGVYSITAVIDSKIKVREAIHRGWRTFMDHWLISLEAGALILLVQLCVIVLTAGAILVLSVPFMALLLITAYLNLPVLAVIVGSLAAISVVLAMCLVAAFLTTFQVSVWWQLWHKFGEKGLMSGLERWFVLVKKHWKK